MHTRESGAGAPRGTNVVLGLENTFAASWIVFGGAQQDLSGINASIDCESGSPPGNSEA